MPRIMLSPFAERIAALYAEMEAAYARTARNLDFSCAGCPDNCCDSYFTHHTYIEWAYLWQGLAGLAAEQLAACRLRAEIYEQESSRLLAQNKRPQLMCPLHEQGLCSVYPYRLMICRLHGVPAALTRPDGRRMEFPGCFRCQEIVADSGTRPILDRTALLRQLADLEIAWLGTRRALLPKVKITIAAMIIQGPPVI
jgi:hypothetical protein